MHVIYLALLTVFLYKFSIPKGKLRIVMYKSIMVCNNERTPQVIRNALIKLGLDGNPDSFTISQVLPDKDDRSRKMPMIVGDMASRGAAAFDMASRGAAAFEDSQLMMPQNANVFYAVDTACNLNFILRPKKPSEKDSGSPLKSRTLRK